MLEKELCEAIKSEIYFWEESPITENLKDEIT
jgi:hypothetical protein